MRFSASVSLPLPTSSMSGSFQWPGPAYFSRPACWLRMAYMRSQCGRNIAGRAPQVGAHRGPHSHTASHAILAKNRRWAGRWPSAPCPSWRRRRSSCASARPCRWAPASPSPPDEAAQVVLQVVDAPLGVELARPAPRGLRAFKAGAGLRSRRGIDADLQPLRVYIIGQRFHVGELRVGVQHAVARRARPPRCRRC